jgi:hypothetical protein
MSVSDSEQGDPNRRLGDNRGPSIEDPGPARDYQLVGPLAAYSDAVDPDHLERFLAAIRSHGDPAIRQAAISNALHRARADRKVTHVQYRLLEQTASRSRWVARYSSEPQEVRAWFASLKSGSNVGRFDAALVAVDYLVTIEGPRRSGGWPLVFSTIKCSPGDRTGESHKELLGRARRLFNGQERAARAGYNWCAETEPDASPTCNGYDLDGAASRNGYSSPTQNQGASRNGYESASRNGYELIVYRDTTTPEGGVPKGVLGTPFARAVPDPTEAITEQQFEEVRSLADTFGKRPGAMVVRQTRRDEIEGDLRTTVQPVVEKHGAQIARQALDQTIVLARHANKLSKSEGGAPSLFRFLFQVLPDQAANVERAEKSRADKQQADQAVQAEIADKRMAAVRSTSPRQPMRTFKR